MNDLGCKKGFTKLTCRIKTTTRIGVGMMIHSKRLTCEVQDSWPAAEPDCLRFLVGWAGFIERKKSVKIDPR